MTNFKLFKDQIIAGTHEDSQGEQIPKEFFERMISKRPNRMALNQQHDMSLESPGHMENLKLIADPQNQGEWHVVADIYVAPEKLKIAMNGFSFSALEVLCGNLESPSHRIYLPYPYYKDEAFIQDLASSDEDVLVGRWIKKSADPLAVGLIVAAVTLVVRPEWEIQYKEKIRPIMVKLLTHTKTLLSKGISVDLVQHVEGHQGENIKVYFVPDRERIEYSFQELLITQALQDVAEFLSKDSKSMRIGIETIKFYYEKTKSKYVLFEVQYLDGSSVHFA